MDDSNFVKQDQDMKPKVMLVISSWLSRHHPELQPYLLHYLTGSVSEVRGEYFCSCAVNTPSGYQYFQFWVTLPEDPEEEAIVQEVKE